MTREEPGIYWAQLGVSLSPRALFTHFLRAAPTPWMPGLPGLPISLESRLPIKINVLPGPPDKQMTETVFLHQAPLQISLGCSCLVSERSGGRGLGGFCSTQHMR